jgi:hypothetical protein
MEDALILFQAFLVEIIPPINELKERSRQYAEIVCLRAQYRQLCKHHKKICKDLKKRNCVPYKWLDDTTCTWKTHHMCMRENTALAEWKDAQKHLYNRKDEFCKHEKDIEFFKDMSHLPHNLQVVSQPCE